MSIAQWCAKYTWMCNLKFLFLNYMYVRAVCVLKPESVYKNDNKNPIQWKYYCGLNFIYF